MTWGEVPRGVWSHVGVVPRGCGPTWGEVPRGVWSHVLLVLGPFQTWRRDTHAYYCGESVDGHPWIGWESGDGKGRNQETNIGSEGRRGGRGVGYCITCGSNGSRERGLAVTYIPPMVWYN